MYKLKIQVVSILNQLGVVLPTRHDEITPMAVQTKSVEVEAQIFQVFHTMQPAM